jgi:hypothetical protein
VANIHSVVDSRLLTAVVGLVASLAVSALLWIYFETVLFFLFVPFVPFLFRGLGGDEREETTPRECPHCGFQSLNDEYEYCPRDGQRLREPREKRTERGGTDNWS